MTAERVARIRERLAALEPISLEIEDESHLHAGHAGARDGKGHFRVCIVSPQFAGLNPLQRHRLVFATVGDLMDTDIHALTIDAQPPAQ